MAAAQAVDVMVAVVVQVVWLFGELLEFQQDHILLALVLEQVLAVQTT